MSPRQQDDLEPDDEPVDDEDQHIRDIARDVAQEVLEGLGLSKAKDPEPEPDDEPDEPVEETKLESPRVVEGKTERRVREALGGLNITVNTGGEKTEKKEPESTPAGQSKLSQFIWGKSA